MARFRWLMLILATTLIAGACGGDDDTSDGTTNVPVGTGPMEFGSTSFPTTGALPTEYTCDGEDISPAFDWTDGPSGTQTYAIELLDRDADGFVHWIIYDIPADQNDISANVVNTADLADGAKQAINSFGAIGYGGPCPPAGEEHEYVFRVYALDTALEIEGGGGALDVKTGVADHTLAMSELAVKYAR